MKHKKVLKNVKRFADGKFSEPDLILVMQALHDITRSDEFDTMRAEDVVPMMLVGAAYGFYPFGMDLDEAEKVYNAACREAWSFANSLDKYSGEDAA